MKKLIKSANSVPDFRHPWGHLLHKLSDILIISFCAIICGAQTYRDLEVFGNAKRDWLSLYLPLPNGIPNADTFERIFELLDPSVVAKNMRWILELLDTINVEKSIVTIDAMGTQTKIAEKIISKNADYCLALKGNQSSIHEDVRLYFETEKVIQVKKTLEKGHGRIERREYYLETEIEWLYGRSCWPGLRAIGAVKSIVESKEKSTVETRYFLTSLSNVDDFARSVRAHWGIENCLHWHLDVTFSEDSSKIRNKNAAGVWNVLRKLALEHLKKQVYGGMSLKNLQKLAGWDSSFLERVLFASE